MKVDKNRCKKCVYFFYSKIMNKKVQKNNNKVIKTMLGTNKHKKSNICISWFAVYIK